MPIVYLNYHLLPRSKVKCYNIVMSVVCVFWGESGVECDVTLEANVPHEGPGGLTVTAQ